MPVNAQGGSKVQIISAKYAAMPAQHGLALLLETTTERND
jgi:hypothetical protein